LASTYTFFWHLASDSFSAFVKVDLQDRPIFQFLLFAACVLIYSF